MKDFTKLALYVGVFLLTMWIILVVFSGLMIIITTKAECEKLDSYGYEVRHTGNWYSPKCEIKTERGFWIRSYDFDITSVEEFVRR